MSAWHDPRGRLVVDGEGRTVGRVANRHRRAELNDPDRRMMWCHCHQCWGYILSVWVPRDDRTYDAPHSCRPERHQ